MLFCVCAFGTREVAKIASKIAKMTKKAEQIAKIMKKADEMVGKSRGTRAIPAISPFAYL